MPSRAIRYLTGALSLAFVASAWFFLAPQQLGGSVAYTVTTGNSMEPFLREGDLVIVKEQEMYGVGDAVAYRSHELGRTVLHRIIGGEGDRFVFKGDNNDFIDPEKPAREDLMGGIWFHIPKVGLAVRFLQTPVAWMVGGFLVVASLGLFGAKRRKRDASAPRHSSKKGLTGPDPLPFRPTATIKPAHDRASSPGARRILQAIAAITGLMTVAFLTLGTISVAAPATSLVAEEVGYTHSGSFTYEAPAPDGPAYDGPTISLGEPVFLNLVDEVDAVFAYRFKTDVEHDVVIDGRMSARVGADNGFARTIALRTQRVATEDAVTFTAPIDLTDLKSLVREVEKTTGVEQSTYTLSIQPEVSVNGTVASHPFQDAFTRTIRLRFDDFQLQPLRNAEGEVAADVFEPSQSGSIRVSRTVATSLAVFGVKLPVATATRTGLIGGGVSLLLLLAACSLLTFVLPRDEAARIRTRYASLIVPVREIPSGIHDSVDVPDIDALAKLAQQFEELILHYSSRQSHSYMVFHGGLLYRYRTNVNVQPLVDPSILDEPVREVGILG